MSAKETNPLLTALGLIPAALIVGSIAYIVIGVQSMPPLKYHYSIKSTNLPEITEGPFDSLESCERDWVATSISLESTGSKGLGHYELTGCAAIFD
jgi:hypothetical protein